MRFVFANVLLLSGLSLTLYYQYFFRSPLVVVAANAATHPRSPSSTNLKLPIPIPSKILNAKKLASQDWKLSLNCKNSEQSFKRSDNSVILNIKKCEKEFPKEIIVENETNGFTASLFALSNSHAKTDSIPLKKGKNIIVIKYQIAKSKKISKNEEKIAVVERLSIEH